MSTEYTISSKVIECGSKGRTIPFFFPWLDSTIEPSLPVSAGHLKRKKCSTSWNIIRIAEDKGVCLWFSIQFE